MTRSQTQADRAELRIRHRVSGREQIAHSPTAFSPNQTQKSSSFMKKRKKPKQNEAIIIFLSCVEITHAFTHAEKTNAVILLAFVVVHLTHRRDEGKKRAMRFVDGRLDLGSLISEAERNGHILGKPVPGSCLQINPAALQRQTLTWTGNGKESGVLIVLVQRRQW